MDQVVIRAKSSNKSTMVIYADPKARGYHDLLIKGGQFYAVYDPVSKFWKKGLDDLSELIDNDLASFAETYSPPGSEKVVVEYMNSMSNGAWNRYLTQMKGLSDDKILLDQKVMFANDDVKREDYASFKESYSLEDSPTPFYDKLMSTIYDEDQRRKLEWGIGLLVDGNDLDKVQKFFVICGDPGTGKSTVLNIIQELFDGYISYFNAKELGQGYTFATDVFKNAPLIAIQTDGDLSNIRDNTVINQISGHEEIIINEKGVKRYAIKTKTMMFMATNKAVQITDSRSGIIRRLIDVYPTGNTLNSSEYFDCMDHIKYELGGIAKHCLDVYKSMGPMAYSGYVAKEMVARTNDIYAFLSSQLDRIEHEKSLDGDQLWRDFKGWCDDANVTITLKKQDFISELESYFKNVTKPVVHGRRTTRNNIFSEFKWNKFVSDGDRSESKPIEIKVKPLVLDKTKSYFDKIAADYLAQYAANNDIGNPQKPWTMVHTTLKDIDTSKLHWVQVPENHIVLDFDIRGDDGEKSLEKNLEAAAKYPPTYAELSKSGKGVHLHYIYDGDPTKLKPLIDVNIECKVYKGKSALRRKLTFCNDLPIAHISSGLPLKGEKSMINEQTIKDEKHLRRLIINNCKKMYMPGTKPSIDFICKLLDEAYDSEMPYNVEDMKPMVTKFAEGSTHQKDYCLRVVSNMKWRSDIKQAPAVPDPDEKEDKRPITFYDTEVFPNLFMICYKDEGDEKEHPVKTLINPKPEDVRALCRTKLVGFNNRKYDNHILYAWGWLNYTNDGLYRLSQDIVNGKRNALFPNAFNLSYTDIYDFSAKKQGLKKWEIELGIDHHELGMRWDEPVPKEKWDLVKSYCEDDVRATEAVFNHLHEDFVARQGLANLSGLTVNDSTNQHVTRIVFGDVKHPQNEFPWPDLHKEFPGYTFDKFADREHKSKYLGEYPSEGGYVYVYGMGNGDGVDYHNMTLSYNKPDSERLKDFEKVYSDFGMDLKELHPDLIDKLSK